MTRTFCRTIAVIALVAMAGCTTQTADQLQAADSTAALRSASPSAGSPGAAVSPAATGDVGDVALAPRSGLTAVEYYTAAMLGRVADSLARGSSTGHVIEAHGNFEYLQLRRVSSGVPEVHDRWIDVAIVQAGHGTLLSGGHVRGSTAEGGGEHRGGEIEGGATREVGPGDLMVIPAGTPHQYRIAKGDSLRYVTVKVLASSH